MKALLFAAVLTFSTLPALAQKVAPQTLFTNVHVFDGVNDKRMESASVLVEGKLIKKVSTTAIDAPGATIIDGGGRTLMPGLIDGHAHISLVAFPHALANDMHWMEVGARVTAEAEKMLLRGFTTIRDAGGPVYGLAKAIDDGAVPGPRIYPSGHFIGQTSGHSDFRSYTESHPRDRAGRSNFEINWAFIADGPDQVRAYTREVLRLGATQIKLSVGGGSSSAYDPLDTVQYSVAEIRAAVEAAADWGTYVMVHAYHDRSIMRSIEAGVKSIDHGTLMVEDKTAIAMREAGVIYNPQALIFSPTKEMIAAADPATLAKGAPVRANLNTSMTLAKKHGVKIAFGVDSFGNPERLGMQNLELTSRLKWFTPVEILRQATSVTGELVALSGPRNPYKDGPLGVIAEGAYADILLVDGNPLENIEILTDPAENINLIMKDGKIYKNTL